MGESWDFGQEMVKLNDLEGEDLMGAVLDSDWLTIDSNGVHVKSIGMTKTTKEKIRLAMKHAPARKEWAGFMDIVGHDDNDTPVIGNLDIPDQIPLAQTVDFQVEDPGYGRDVAIHSHHQMGTFHSGTDDCGVDANNDISIVLAFGEGGNIESKARVRVRKTQDQIVRAFTDIKIIENGFMEDFVSEFSNSLKEQQTSQRPSNRQLQISRRSQEKA